MNMLNSKGIIEDWTQGIIEGRTNPYFAMHELDKNLDIVWKK